MSVYETSWRTKSGKTRQIWLYGVWASMKQRCNNPMASNYARYGGRGIAICNIWERDWPSFRRWALANGYRKGLQIDRIDNDGNYEPSNCRWVNRKVQARNSRKVRLIYFNRQIKTVKEWAELVGIDPSTMSWRLKNWTQEKALTTSKIPRCERWRGAG